MTSINLKKDVAAAVVCTTKQLSELRTVKNIRLDQYKEFSDILRIKYDNQEEEINKNEDYELDRVFYFGLKKWAKEEMGYEITHKGKVADKRILKKLGRIANEFLKIHTYPLVDATVLHTILNKALGDVDPRSLKNYRKTVLDYCNHDEDIIDRCKDSRLGKLNVSRFVKRIPRSFIVGD